MMIDVYVEVVEERENNRVGGKLFPVRQAGQL